MGGACFAGAARSWWGPDRGPLGLRPLARGVFFRVPRESSSSDVLTRTSGRRGEHPPTGAPYTDASSKAPLRSLPDAFHRRMPARPDACAPSLERGPATEPRFCHPGSGFRRSFAPSPREGEGARPSRFSESSSLRCVRGHAPFVDFCQRDDPQARPSDDRHPGWWRVLTFARSSPHNAGPRCCPLASPFDRSSSRTAEPRSLGSGAFLRRVALARSSTGTLQPRWLAAEASPQPDVARTPHVALFVLSPAGVAEEMCDAPTNPPIFRGFVPTSRLRARSRGPPPAPLREEKMRSAAPEVPSVRRSPFREGSIHRLSPTCGG